MPRLKYTVLLALLFLLPFCSPMCANAQTNEADSTRSVLDTVIGDAAIVGEDGLAFLLSPLSFRSDDLIRVGTVAAVTGFLMVFDEDLQALPRHNQSRTLQDVSDVFNYGGHLPSAEIATGVVYLAGLASGSDDIRIMGRMMAQSLIYSGSMYLVLRVLAGRHRPFSGDGAYTFDTGQTDNTYQSFPSGHTTVAFSLATVLAGSVDHPVASILIYGAAAMTGLSRIYQDNHWTSDVFLGAMLGVASGLFVRHQEELRHSGTTERSWFLHPDANGVTLTVRL